MKILLMTICLGLAACADTTNNLENLCLHKDPNQLTERELEMCKAFLSRPIIYQD